MRRAVNSSRVAMFFIEFVDKKSNLIIKKVSRLYIREMIQDSSVRLKRSELLNENSNWNLKMASLVHESSIEKELRIG